MQWGRQLVSRGANGRQLTTPFILEKKNNNIINNKMIKTIFTFLMLISACFTKAQTVEELRDSMAAGNLNMQVLLGIRYLDGDGVAEDSKEGLRLIQDAADKGNRFGELWLGI